MLDGCLEMININKYIEDNIELLDTDLKKFFINVYIDLSDQECQELLVILGAAGIDYRADRESALHHVLGLAIRSWIRKSPDENEFLNIFADKILFSNLGFTNTEIMEFIKTHISDWPLIKLGKLGHLEIVEKVK